MEIVAIKDDTFYREYKAGRLGTVSDPSTAGRSISSWLHCREIFHNRLTRKINIANITKKEAPVSFAFSCGSKPAISNVVNFIREVESRCGCPSEQQLVIKETTFSGVILIELTEFWKQSHCRNLLTILLRAGILYDGSNFSHIIGTSPYLMQTPVAIKRFLAGYTKYTGKDFSGWVRSFKSKSPEKIEELLIK